MYFQLDKFLGNTALIDDNDVFVSYDELLDMCGEMRRAIPQRALVFTLGRAEIGHLAGYITFINNEIVPLMLNASTDRGLFDNLVGTYHPSYIWLPEVLAEGFPYERIYGRYGYCLLKTGLAPFDLHPDLGLLLATSGSTGSPKLVRLSYKNLYGELALMNNYLKDEVGTRCITTIPLDHNYGLILHTRLLQFGCTALMTTRSIVSREYWEFFKKYGATSLGGVPFIYELLEKVGFRNMGLTTVHSMTEAGGLMSADMQIKYGQYCIDRGIEFVISYGQTEAPCGILSLPTEDSVRKVGSTGKVVLPGWVDLIDEAGNIITTPGVPGEIVYTGDVVCMSYAVKGEDLAVDDQFGGVLHTGDIAQFDEEGYYYIVGRKARFLKMLGDRISLDEVENLLHGEYPGIELACTGKDDAMKIFASGVDQAILDGMLMFVFKKTGVSHTLMTAKALADMPRLGIGKIDYSALKEL